MRRLALLLALLPALAAPQCSSKSLDATIAIEPSQLTVPANSWFDVEVVVETHGGAAVQAWELAVRGAFPVVLPISATPHPEFDDDGALFVTTRLDLEGATLSRIVDLRHGPAATGRFHAVTLHLFAGAPGQTTLRVSGEGLAGPDGSPLDVALFGTSITVQ
jgi:hypothetical protein